MHQLGRTAPRSLAQHRDLIGFAIGRIPAQRILPKEFRCDDHINMPARSKGRQIRAIWVGKLVKRDGIGQFFNARYDQIQHRRLGLACGVDMLDRRTCGTAAAMLVCGDHVGIGLDTRLAVHRERPRIGRRGQRGRVDCQGLVRMAQLQFGRQAAPVHRIGGRAVSAIIDHLEVPPPLFRGVDGPVAQLVIKAGQGFRGLRNRHGQFAERGLCKQSFKVPRTGFHAASAHRAIFLADAVGGAFLAVGFPNLIAVEHQLWPRGNRPAWAFAGTFITSLAKFLQAKINWFVMGHRHICRHHAGFQPRPKKRVEDHLANPADLAQARQQ